MIEAIIFDYGRTLYNPDTEGLFPNTLETLSQLKAKGLRLSIVSIAETDNIYERFGDFDKMGLTPFFEFIGVVKRSGEKDLRTMLRDFGLEENAQRCAVVGDNLKREITMGNQLGAFTIWTKQNLSADWQPENQIQVPKAIIYRIEELIPLFDQINNQ